MYNSVQKVNKGGKVGILNRNLEPWKCENRYAGTYYAYYDVIEINMSVFLNIIIIFLRLLMYKW